MRVPKAILKEKDLARVQNAESLLRLGDPKQALLELQRLTRAAWMHPWPEQLVWKVAQTLQLSQQRA